MRDVLPDETVRAADIRRAAKDGFDDVDRQLELALSVLPSDDGLKVTRTRGLGPRTGIVVLALFSKQIKTTRAIARVADGGLGDDALALVRVQFETMVAIAWILHKRSRERTAMYLAHMVANGLKTLEQWKLTEGLKRQARKKVFAAHTAQLAAQAAKLKMTPEALKAKVKKHWSGLGTLEQVLQKLKSIPTYQTFYRLASPISHASDAIQHIGIDGVLRIVPDDTHIVLALRTAAFQLWWSTERINERFGLGHDAEISAAKPLLLIEHDAKRRKRKGNP